MVNKNSKEYEESLKKLSDRIFKILTSDGTFMWSRNLSKIINRLPNGCLKDNSLHLANLCIDFYMSVEVSYIQILRVLVLVKRW